MGCGRSFEISLRHLQDRHDSLGIFNFQVVVFRGPGALLASPFESQRALVQLLGVSGVWQF